MAILEMVWDCLYCKRTNRGPAKHCAGCGTPRGDEVQFYLPEGAREVTDAREAARAKAGPDWTCEHCGGDNLSDNEYCDNCGASKGTSPSRETREGLSREEIERKPEPKRRRPPLVDSSPPEERETRRSLGLRVPSFGQKGRPQMPKSRNLLIGVAVFVVLALIVGAGYLLFVSHEEPLTIAGFQWTRDIEIEQFKTLTRQGWAGEVPGDARILSQSYEIRSYRQVLSHYETRTRQVSYQVSRIVSQTCYRDLGNGYAESYDCSYTTYDTEYRTETYQEPVYRDEPVYDTRYTYEVDRWVTDHTEHAEGDDQNPSWPEFNLGDKEREGRRFERYTLVLIGRGEKEHRHDLDYEQWLALNLGGECQGEFNTLGMLRSLECQPES